ncbi:Ecdysteroid kinase-like family [Popillia japonica]|uniref:Ecdysteroid kinase-like family n=1 Tax=Popillia japonica TaxID=7064 RepID=A0AAW1K1G5_POPJA
MPADVEVSVTEDVKAIIDKIITKYGLENIIDIKYEVGSQAGDGPRDYINEYSILTQGDCWCNNMMFKYPAEGPKYPTDIMLIDWQLLRQASPVFDISYFFYTIASEDALNNLDDYLRIYHEELSKRITRSW